MADEETKQEEVTPEETKPIKEPNLAESVWNIIDERIGDIANLVHEFGITRGMGIKVAKEEMEQQHHEVSDKYDILLNYFASWMFPQSKENRRLFVLLNMQDAFNKTMLTLFCKFFGYKNAGENFAKLFEEHLTEAIEQYEKETSMVATEEGLRHPPR